MQGINHFFHANMPWQSHVPTKMPQAEIPNTCRGFCMKPVLDAKGGRKHQKVLCPCVPKLDRQYISEKAHFMGMQNLVSISCDNGHEYFWCKFCCDCPRHPGVQGCQNASHFISKSNGIQNHVRNKHGESYENMMTERTKMKTSRKKHRSFRLIVTDMEKSCNSISRQHNMSWDKFGESLLPAAKTDELPDIVHGDFFFDATEPDLRALTSNKGQDSIVPEQSDDFFFLDPVNVSSPPAPCNTPNPSVFNVDHLLGPFDVCTVENSLDVDLTRIESLDKSCLF